MLERSSNEIAHKLFPGTVLEKPTPDPGLVFKAGSGLPIAGRFVGLAGTGDFDCRKSSGGSVALSYDVGVVAKVPLGKLKGDVFDRAKGMSESLREFASVAPDSLVIISRADNGEPKPVVIQSEIYGAPLCDTPIRDLMKLNTLKDVRKIASKMKVWYWKNRAYDLCGQRTSNSFWGIMLPFTPSLSDNIMVEKSGHAYLVDNMVDSKVRVDTINRRYKDFIRRNIFHNIPLIILDTLILARTVYDYLRGEKSVVVVGDQQLVR